MHLQLRHATVSAYRLCGGLGRPRGFTCEWEGRARMYSHGRKPGSVDHGEEATGGAIEGEASVLPGRVLTQSRESLHVAPDRSGIRLVLLGQCVRLSGLLLRQIQSRRDRIEHRVARRTELLGDGPQDQGTISGGVGVDVSDPTGAGRMAVARA